MDAALNQFYQHLGVERGLASLTLAAYARDLLDFWVFIEERGRSHWGAVALADLQDYFAAQEARGLSARSRARRRSALRQFLRFVQREEQVAGKPGLALRGICHFVQFAREPAKIMHGLVHGGGGYLHRPAGEPVSRKDDDGDRAGDRVGESF